MKKSIPIGILVLIMVAILGYYWISLNDRNKSDEYLTEKDLLAIAGDDDRIVTFIQTVTERPEEVIRINSLLREMVYSGEYEEKERRELLVLQRQLFSQPLLDKNELEKHIFTVESEVEKWRKSKLAIIGSEQIKPIYLRDGEVAIIKVVFYTSNSKLDLYYDYALVKNQNSKWHIMGWRVRDEFETNRG